MNHPFPDTAVLRQAVSLASRAPSVRNSQPWAWKFGARSIDLFLAEVGESSKAAGDEREGVLSCGIALQHMRTALSAFGWCPVVTRLPDPARSRHLAHIEVRPRTATARDVALASAIPRRRTDRRHYAAWSVPQGYLDLIELRCADEGAELRITANSDDDGALLAVTTDSDDASSRLRAGEAVGVILLEATALGSATCRLIEPTVMSVSRHQPRLHVVVPCGMSQTVVRVGWPEANADPLPPTPRRGVDSMAAADDVAYPVTAR